MQLKCNKTKRQQQKNFLGGIGNFGSYDVAGWLLRLKKPSDSQSYVALSESVISFLLMHCRDITWKYVVPSAFFAFMHTTGGIDMHSCCKAAFLK